MHMNPNQLDADGIVSGKLVHEGDRIGKVGNYNNRERGTTYHLHFDMQVPTKLGWVFVNPYMTLVAAYERLIGARGTEIKDDDPVPPVAGVPPVIVRPSETPAVALAPVAHTEESAAVRAKTAQGERKAKQEAQGGQEKTPARLVAASRFLPGRSPTRLLPCGESPPFSFC